VLNLTVGEKLRTYYQLSRLDLCWKLWDEWKKCYQRTTAQRSLSRLRIQSEVLCLEKYYSDRTPKTFG